MTDTRIDPPFIADEGPMLHAWLDWHRETLAVKCAGLTEEQLRLRSAEPSTLSLLGLVQHMTDVERNWFRNVLNGEGTTGIYYSDDDPDGDFDTLETPVDQVFERWHGEIAHARKLSAGLPLDEVGKAQRRGQDVSLRWILVHMIEEYARHNGHADIIRQRIDGVTGE
ncbi:putative damage-inducible protein DinB [Streptosporangium becharense]|uniref:Putative damage-inducible protein DinB n=1 Tax=Streptosporangium becharense TaxID=1816182 RepID=A0A7W9IJT2_9ACTN|nr:DinB family protein [Streptosporangium becharense]MBB2910911.1 putative damage-inducible protein DinB [Streptosporangium becharense]MBB5822030.1 putative damage-inducible protein DinB [Streptosporangium becharense]